PSWTPGGRATRARARAATRACCARPTAPAACTRASRCGPAPCGGSMNGAGGAASTTRSGCCGSWKTTTATNGRRSRCCARRASPSSSSAAPRRRGAIPRSTASGCAGRFSSARPATSRRGPRAARCSRGSWPRGASIARSRRSRGAWRAGVRLSDGTTLTADAYVFACGPWLGRLFPDVLGERIRVTRQEVFFFGTPPGDPRFTEEALPVWADHGARFMYGIPGNEWRGFKVADDTRGPPFDPTSGERLHTPAALRAVRDYLAVRFPALADAPLLEARVCQYENSPTRISSWIAIPTRP